MIKFTNRKNLKKRKMKLKRKGLEIFYPRFDEVVTLSPNNFPYKIAKHFIGQEIKCGKLRGYEFTRPIKIKSRKYITCRKVRLIKK